MHVHDAVACGSILSKTTCGFCANAKKVMSRFVAEFAVLELNNVGASAVGAPAAFGAFVTRVVGVLPGFEDMEYVQNKLQEVTGSRTVPQVFIGGQRIGGHDGTRPCPTATRTHPHLSAGAPQTFCASCVTSQRRCATWCTRPSKPPKRRRSTATQLKWRRIDSS